MNKKTSGQVNTGRKIERNTTDREAYRQTA